MEFSHFLSSYLPDPSYGGKRLFADMVEQATTAERLRYRSVTIPEHHLINILLTPSPLQMAVKVASVTDRLELATSVVVLPIRDMRVFAGEVAQADILTDGRLVLGVGRGAFAYEMGRLGSPIEESREKFDESLDLLIALLTREEVGWSGKYYNFEPLTIMPRPLTTICSCVRSEPTRRPRWARPATDCGSCCRASSTAPATPPTSVTSSSGPTTTTSGSTTCASAIPRW